MSAKINEFPTSRYPFLLGLFLLSNVLGRGQLVGTVPPSSRAPVSFSEISLDKLDNAGEMSSLANPTGFPLITKLKTRSLCNSGFCVFLLKLCLLSILGITFLFPLFSSFHSKHVVVENNFFNCKWS